MSKIENFKEYLSNYGPQTFDSWCGEPIGWGYKITKHLGDENFKELSMLGEMECIYPNWYLITKRLTREEAIDEYGEQTNLKLGPKGGFKTITFGDKTFCQKDLMI